jgi:hypothetical protein
MADGATKDTIDEYNRLLYPLNLCKNEIRRRQDELRTKLSTTRYVYYLAEEGVESGASVTLTSLRKTELTYETYAAWAEVYLSILDYHQARARDRVEDAAKFPSAAAALRRVIAVDLAEVEEILHQAVNGAVNDDDWSAVRHFLQTYEVDTGYLEKLNVGDDKAVIERAAKERNERRKAAQEEAKRIYRQFEGEQK